MPIKSEAQQLAPLLNPTYWGDLQPGIDIAPAVPTPPYHGRTMPKPEDALTKYVKQMHTYYAHHTYMPGEPFDAYHQPDGTVITYFQELLNTTAESAAAIRQEYQKEAEQSVRLPFDDELKPIARYTHRLDSGESTYVYGQRWGVVVTHQQTQAKTILTRQACDIDFDQKKVYAGVEPMPLAVRFIVGKTFSYDPSEQAPYDPETFVRIKRLHIAGYIEKDDDIGGKSKKMLSKLGALLTPQSITNPSQA